MKTPKNTELEAKQSPEIPLLNALLLGGSNSIVRQEALGQSEFVGSDTLPREMMSPDTRAVLEAAGVQFLGPVENDDQFQYAKLPTGWRKVATDHSMWSKLVDERGRERAAIFYKAAFYDRHAHISASPRFSVQYHYDRFELERVGVARVFDAGAVVFETAPERRYEGDRDYNVTDRACANAIRWLAEHYPDWQRAGAYWEVP